MFYGWRVAGAVFLAWAISIGPRLGFLLGLQNIGFGAGAMLGPVFAGALFDWLGSYTLAFLVSAATALASAAVISTACVIRGIARE